MTQRDVFKAFMEISRTTEQDIEAWFPNGRDSVRVRLKNKKELIFTYDSPNYWRLETKGAYLTDMK